MTNAMITADEALRLKLYRLSPDDRQKVAEFLWQMELKSKILVLLILLSLTALHEGWA